MGLVPFEDPMSEFYVWVTLLTEAYVDGLIARLARRRYNVGAQIGRASCRERVSSPV